MRVHTNTNQVHPSLTEKIRNKNKKERRDNTAMGPIYSERASSSNTEKAENELTRSQQVTGYITFSCKRSSNILFYIKKSKEFKNKIEMGTLGPSGLKWRGNFKCLHQSPGDDFPALVIPLAPLPEH
jgi:hypothetical protein